MSLVVIATGRYRSFVPGLVTGARTYLGGLDRVFVLSDSRPPADSGVTWLPWGHMPWPYPTLLRYRAMTAYAASLAESEVLMYLDVDMRLQRPIELPRVQGLLAVEHPGFVGAMPETLPFERRPESMSFIEPGVGGAYFAGGVQGGTSVAYLTACAAIAKSIQTDLDRGIVPVWHDESAWNHYLTRNPPAAVLPASYCSPEYRQASDAFIIALDKNHDRLRQTPLKERTIRRLTALRNRARRGAIRSFKRFAGRS